MAMMVSVGRSTHPKKYLSPDETARVEQAIADAERRTSAELKLVLVRHCWRDIRDRAADVFRRHDLHRTREHNAVLILLVTSNREFLIYGDRGINGKVGPDYWWDVRDAMLAPFGEDRIGDGLCGGISMIADKLATHFPVREDDVNELPDEVVADE